MHIRTSEPPVEERFACWHETCCGSFTTSRIRNCEHGDDFQATARVVTLGTVQVSALTYPSVRLHQPSKLIRQSNPEQSMLWLHQSGTIEFGLTRHQATAPRPQEIILYDSPTPFTGVAPPSSQTLSGLLLEVPQTPLPLPVAPLSGAPLSGRVGVGAVLARYLVDLVRHADQYRPSDTARLSTVTLDLLATFLHSLHGDADTAVRPDARQRILQMRIHDFIQQRLDDPALTLAMIAEAHHISTRYLHKLFADQGLTVAGWIRQRRLERCRRDLTDPKMHSQPVHAIAARWGFTDAAHFSRLFRSTYGLPPAAYRRLSREKETER